MHCRKSIVTKSQKISSLKLGVSNWGLAPFSSNWGLAPFFLFLAKEDFVREIGAWHHFK